MNAFTNALKALINVTPYRIRRAQAVNRFESFSDSLALLARFGFEPTKIIDGGANVGSFALMARAHFPRAHIYLVEPQPACAKSLLGLCARFNFSFHPFALVAQENSGKNVGFLVASGGITTGAHVDGGSGAGDVVRVEVEARSLDDFVGSDLGPADRVFLKLDLEGHELEALKGAPRLLQATDVVLAESSFFGDPAPANSPLKLATFLTEHGFSLYDVISISGRPRDRRARQCDLLFVKDSAPISIDRAWN